MEKNNGLPKGWESTKLDLITKSRKIGIDRSRREQFDSGTPYLKMNNITSDGRLELEQMVCIQCADQEKIDYRLEYGDIVFNTRNSYELVGKTTIWDASIPLCVYNNNIMRIRTHDSIFPKFLVYYMNSGKFRNSLLSIKRATTNICAIYDKDLKQQIVIVPPLNEQKRIVAKIEELFSKLGSLIESLNKEKQQLKQYRNSLLKSAFMGDLSNEERIKNPDDSILPLLKKMESNKSKQEKKLQKIPIPENTKPFHQIPNAWKWIRMGNVCLRLQYGTSEKANGSSNGIPVLRMGNIVEGELYFTNLKYYPKNWKKRDEFLLEPGDILFNRTNSSELVGKTAEYKSEHPEAVFASYLIRAIIDPEILKPSLLSYYVNSVFGRMFIKSVVSQQVGQANVNGTKFSLMLIPLIPMNEQKALLDKIDFGMSLIHKMKEEVDVQLTNLFRMKQSILKQAFEGKLVPQDPNDEPASELLKIIKINSSYNKK